MNYSIVRHTLIGDRNQVLISPTRKMGGPLNPRFLVIHYTAGASFESDLHTLAVDRNVQASVHLLIGRSGEITQIAPFNRITWHAGLSQWGQISGFNSHAIGIELSNAGLLKKTANGNFITWFNHEIPSSEVIEAAHRRGGPVVGWHTYTPQQLQTLLEVAHVLHSRYQFLEILGHDDISWPRKTDPGPAFPMESLRSRVLGRRVA